MRGLLSKLILTILVLLLAIGLLGRFYAANPEPENTEEPVAAVTPEPEQSEEPQESPQPQESSTTEEIPAETPETNPEPAVPETPAESPQPQESASVESIQPEPVYTEDPVFTDVNSLLIVANKTHRLPEGYAPADLINVNDVGGWGTIAPYMRAEAAYAVAEMTQAAAADGVTLMFSSAYRSESYQKQLYDGYVAQYGVERADRISSRPGYSDHQTGLALDFIEGKGADFTSDFEYSASGIWLRDNAHYYGFIMRYPKGKADITGYSYEPWHFRYVGVDTATAIYNVDVFCSFEEYFGVSGGTEYK